MSALDNEFLDEKALAEAMAEAPSNAAPDLPENGGLEVVSIAKSYDKRAVLSDISLTVAKGEVLGLLGPNGAGKTTCFYSIMGLVKPDSGRILMDGVDVTKLPMYRRAILGLGYLPQETSIFRGMTVEQNINCVLEMVEPDKEVRRQELERLLEEFHITRLRDSPAMALSGGERRRCEIARALAAKPSIMLLDEPTASLDLGHQVRLMELLSDLCRQGRCSVVMVSHDLNLAARYADHILLLSDGKTAARGNPRDVFKRDILETIYQCRLQVEIDAAVGRPSIRLA